MHSHTLQALRGEIEAITTLQLALNRIALTVDDNALSMWDGPRPEDVDELAADDGSFLRETVTEFRARAGNALARRYQEVERAVLGRTSLQSLVRSALHTATGGAIGPSGPSPEVVLSALARSGAIRLDQAQAASAMVREALDARAEAPPLRPTAPATPRAKSGKKPTPGRRAAVKKALAKKPPTKKKAISKSSKPSKKPAKKSPKKSALKKR